LSAGHAATPLPPTFSPHALSQAFPEFEIDADQLGPGGYKAVYRALLNGTEVVLKIVKEPVAIENDTTPSVDARFAREILAMKQIHSPRVVSILDGPATRVIDGAERVWYLEPYYAGGDLSRRLANDGEWPRDRVVQLYLGLLEGVSAVSAAGLVHRDIKPLNIVFDAVGDPVLLDLGVALHMNLAALTASSDVAPKTWPFAAPEQFDAHRDAVHDVRTDLFLVGLTTFYAWTNAHPFQPELPNYLDRLRSGQVNLAPVAGRLADPLAVAVLRLLRPQLHERFRSPELARKAIVGGQS
jgi:serine/threonine protein kinase